MERLETVQRGVGAGVTVAGLLLFYVTLVLGVGGMNPPEVLMIVGAGTSTVGCLWLAGVPARTRSTEAGGVAEMALASACVPAALFCLFGAVESGELAWAIATLCLWCGILALVGQAARAKRRKNAWRNTDQD
jgi:hypothetical protein